MAPAGRAGHQPGPRGGSDEAQGQRSHLGDDDAGSAVEPAGHIDTRNGIVKGHVIRIDPAAVGGTVGVDVALDEALPPGARQDMSVDGTVELEQLTNVLYVQHPAFGQENSTVTLFKLAPDEQDASRVTVKFGRASVNYIEVDVGAAARATR